MGDRVTRWLPSQASVETEVVATPNQVWDVLTDVTRVGEWSHECHTARWLPGHDGARVGAQFVGRNRSGPLRWGRRCTITELDPERRLVYRTQGGVPPDSTEWTFELEPTPSGGTRIRQSFRLISMPLPTELMIRVILPAHRDRRTDLTADLVRLGEVASGRVAAG